MRAIFLESVEINDGKRKMTVEKVVDGKKIKKRKPMKCDTYSKETGLAMAISKKFFGNEGSYNKIFKELCGVEE